MLMIPKCGITSSEPLSELLTLYLLTISPYESNRHSQLCVPKQKH